MSLLEIQNCTIQYGDGAPAVSDVSLSVEEKEIVSIVGESGSGKTTLIRAVLGILPVGGHIASGKILFQDEDLTAMDEDDLCRIRGEKIAMIFQDVGASLDPIRRVESQYTESIRTHHKIHKRDAVAMEEDMLSRVKLADPDRILQSYPFELSGGMKQRVGIAMSMTARPRLLLADEPTSALDVTVQAQVVRELKELRDKYDAAIILVTHNMGVASYISDRIGVMKSGELVEYGTRDEVIYHPQHEYTKSLLDAVPRLEGKRFAK